ncbi:MAG: formate dehydrogenase subunit alpha [Gemmatales bacterium]|nr:formate dehydrogenase subunit alpha [Gemmatales bacterium]MDW7995723.1 formate dehydrogenase subunit alpha [Gemmatales bacterium]
MTHASINGRMIQPKPGQTILQAAQELGITIPTLCYHPDLSPVGSCRLCLVEIEGWRQKVAACVTPIRPGMVIYTETPGLVEVRRFILSLLLRHYYDAGYGGRERPETEFEHWVRVYQVERRRDSQAQPRFAIPSDPHPLVWVDWNKCILCTRCVRACAEIQGRFVWGVADRGERAHIVAGLGSSMLEARCESCGACAAYCPTGALDDKMALGWGRPDKIVRSVCSYCGVGCGIRLQVKNNRIIRVSGDEQAPVNGLHLCVKGRYGFDYVHHPERLRRPRVRRYLLSGRSKSEATAAEREWVEVDWDTALDLAAEKLTQIWRESGSDALGVLASAKCTNEENYLMQKFARQVLGTQNVDHCARLCHSSTVAALSLAFGSGAMSNTMHDVAEHAQALFIIGSNVTEQHPVFGSMLRQAVLRRRIPLVVADPRRIDITEFATLHLQHLPGTDIALLNGLMHIILKNGWHDTRFIAERCENFEAFAASLEAYPPEKVAEITHVPVAALQRAAEILARHKPVAAIWAMGITQHTTGVMNVLALANLQMLLGNLGVPGGGVNPLRGQNNVQGACDMGALPNVFPGYQPVSDAQIVRKFDAAWALQPTLRSSDVSPTLGLAGKPGLTVTEMVHQFGTGQIRALYVLGEDLALTEPDLPHTRQSLAQGEFLILQEIFPSETSVFADILLPGVSFAEKSGTFTNTERRVQLVRAALEPMGDARPDWHIIADLARRVLARQGRYPAGPWAGWQYTSPSAIFEEMAALTPLYAGISHARLEHETLHWPVPDKNHPGTPILFVHGFPRGRGRFHVVEHLPPAEWPDAEYPLLLTTGRVLYHWHGGELTRRSMVMQLCPRPVVEIHPDDAARFGLNGTRQVRLRSRRGEMLAYVQITTRVAPGVVFGNFHFPGPNNVNNLTNAALDPVSKIPEFKVAAVRLEPVPEAC